jgi:type VI secretion system protein ImpM
MRRGLFGKLPSKRDFIAPGATREFLAVWEPWIQSAVASSRMSLGDGWLQSYLTAPIWRFWLGSDTCRTTAIGAVMSSMDGVGRYFPLTLVFNAEPGDTIAPPELDPQCDWFEAVEDFLLSTLDTDRPFDQVAAALETLPSPKVCESSVGGAAAGAGGAFIVPVVNGDFTESFRVARVADSARAYAASTFWWTAGGSEFPQHALASFRMPDASLFASMITGRFKAGSSLEAGA